MDLQPVLMTVVRLTDRSGPLMPSAGRFLLASGPASAGFAGDSFRGCGRGNGCFPAGDAPGAPRGCAGSADHAEPDLVLAGEEPDLAAAEVPRSTVAVVLSGARVAQLPVTLRPVTSSWLGMSPPRATSVSLK